MFGVFHRRASLLCCPYLNITIIRPPSFLQHFSSSSEQQHSFTINYLINNFGFSPATASKLSDRVRLDSPERPDSFLSLFRSHGFSNPQVSRIIASYPKLLSCDPIKTILPKFNFLLSKGASSSDLVQIVTRNPYVLNHSLAKTITPSYEFLKRFLLCDKSIILSLKYCPSLIYSKFSSINVQVLLENGVPESKVALLLRFWGYMVCEHHANIKKAVEEVKELGFNPNSTFFIVAVNAKMRGNSLWERKVDLYKKWGWSEEIIGSAFVKHPLCMLVSVDKIEAVMEFWVNQMGWDSLVLAKYPVLLTLSLEKRIIPRAFVLQFLESRGLIKDAKSATALKMSDNEFLQKYVNCFEKEASQLLKLYENASLSYHGFEVLNK